MEVIKSFYFQIGQMDNFIGNIDYIIEICLKPLFLSFFHQFEIFL